jgi:hypothetical protein
LTVHTCITAATAKLPESVKDLARNRPFLRTPGPAFVFRPPGSYRDVLARRGERQRPDGSPVWPLRVADLPATYQPVNRAGGVR